MTDMPFVAFNMNITDFFYHPDNTGSKNLRPDVFSSSSSCLSNIHIHIRIHTFLPHNFYYDRKCIFLNNTVSNYSHQYLHHSIRNKTVCYQFLTGWKGYVQKICLSYCS